MGFKNVFFGMNIFEIKLLVKEKCYELNLIDNIMILCCWIKWFYDVCYLSFLFLV